MLGPVCLKPGRIKCLAKTPTGRYHHKYCTKQSRGEGRGGGGEGLEGGTAASLSCWDGLVWFCQLADWASLCNQAMMKSGVVRSGPVAGRTACLHQGFYVSSNLLEAERGERDRT